MRKFLLVFILFTASLFSETLKVDESAPWMLPWLVGSLFVVGIFFWSMYKAMVTKNAKYGYGIFLAVILMVVLLFI